MGFENLPLPTRAVPKSAQVFWLEYVPGPKDRMSPRLGPLPTWIFRQSRLWDAHQVHWDCSLAKRRGTSDPLPQPWDHVPLSAALQVSREALLAMEPIQTQHLWEITVCLVIITSGPQGPQPEAGPKSTSLGTSSLPKGSERVLSTPESWQIHRGLSGPTKTTLSVAVSGVWLEDGNILGGKRGARKGD